MCNNYLWAVSSLRISVRVKPGAKRVFVGGIVGEALAVAVLAPAVEGKANEAVITAIAEAFGVKKRDVTVLHGHTGRDKVIEIQGDATVLATRQAELRSHS
jgi:uncharacterized protein (TIGR00251 family)